MSQKRSASEAHHIDIDYSPTKFPRDGTARIKATDAADIGKFEDPWEDEHESEDEAVNTAASEGSDDEMDLDTVPEDDEPHQESPPFILGVDEIPEGYELEADDSTYIMRHDLGVDISCYSLDILLDNLGDNRQKLPTSAFIVAGSQDRRPQNNSISIMKLSSLHRTQVLDSDDESGDEDDNEVLDEDPIVELESIPLMGGVNRVRAQPYSGSQLPPTSQPYFMGVWSETGKVHVYNVRPFIEHLTTPGYQLDRSACQRPSFSVDSHSTEGYAMSWNAPSMSSLSLLTGDEAGSIYLTTAGNAGFRTFSNPFSSHESSVNDLQWSPSEITVFASCSNDRSIRMWDVRSKAHLSVASIADAHGCDVNVLSWNRSTSYLLVSGDDEGEIKVWDLRNIRTAGSQVAQFHVHKAPITAIEWNPNDDSVFAASGDDHQISIWDLAVEADDESQQSAIVRGLPPQMLFNHYQEGVKDFHWHPQIPGTIISTGIGMITVFKPIVG